MKKLIDRLHVTGSLDREQWIQLLSERSEETDQYARDLGNKVRQQIYGNDIYVRGLIEFTNYCKNDCYYCGIRRSNKNAQRYRLTEEDILLCCQQGYELGFRTFVLQGGEDGYYTDERLLSIIHKIKAEYPDCALTLSIGEKSEESYRDYREAGVDRYLLRHETADEKHYGKLHPSSMSCEHRKNCLRTLKKLGFQTGAGFMVGAPYQRVENLADDFLFLKELNPEMVGIGHFYPTSGHPVSWRKKWHVRRYPVLLGTFKTDASSCASSGNHSAGNHSSQGQRDGSPFRGQCSYAEPFAGFCTKKIYAL